MSQPLKSELTAKEFAEAVGRTYTTIRRHLQESGPLRRFVVNRHGINYLPRDAVDWYVEHIKCSGWDRRKRSQEEQ